MRRWRVVMDTVWMRTWGRRRARQGRQGISPRQGAAWVFAVSILLSTVCLPASCPCPEQDEGERFGEIHWYEPRKTEKSP